MKTTSDDLNKIWGELEDIFLNKRKLTKKDYARLKKLGISSSQTKGNHPKIYISTPSKTFIITMSASASDNNWGRQVLRQIRRAYENGKI